MTNAIDWSSIREQALNDFSAAELPPTLKLPALPHAVTQFVHKADQPDVSIKELATIVETDTGLTIEVLRHVNSSYYALRQKASNVQQALTYLGQRQAKMFIMTTGMQAAIRAKGSRLINQSCFWNACLQKALFAREVATLLRADADLAFAGAMLQDYLLPVVSNELLDGYIKFVQQRDEMPECLCAYEREEFGWDHALAAACLAHRWHLPDDLVCCILFHHQGLRILTHPELGRSAVAAVAISALLPDQLRQHYRGLESLLMLQEKWPAFNLEAIATRVDEKHAQIGAGVRNDFPLARRCRAVAGARPNCNDGTLLMAGAR